jgi:hypothetical protein
MSRHDYNSDDAYMGVRIANGVSVILFAVVLVLSGMRFYQTFLQAEQAIRHSISSNGGK